MSAVVKHLEDWLYNTEKWRYPDKPDEAGRRATVLTLRRVLDLINGDIPPCVECLYKKEAYIFGCTECDKIEVEQ